MTRVLITGGAGFIGTSVIRAFRLLYPEVILRAMDLKPPSEQGIEYVIGSILDVNDAMAAVSDCDYVIHLAGMLGVKRTESMPLQCLNVNVQGTMHILDACAKERVKKVVFASSSEVYGDARILPIPETAPVSPRSVYAVSKLTAESYVQSYAGRYGMGWNIVRFFNVYGPGQVAEFVLPRFVAAVQNGLTPTVYGNGDQVRAFCYVDDAAGATVAAALNEGVSKQIFNIGNPNTAVTIAELASRVTTLLGHGHAPSFIPFSNSDRSEAREIQRRIPDISKAERLLGYSPSVGLDEGIRRISEAGPIMETVYDPLDAVGRQSLSFGRQLAHA